MSLCPECMPQNSCAGNLISDATELEGRAFGEMLGHEAPRPPRTNAVMKGLEGGRLVLLCSSASSLLGHSIPLLRQCSIQGAILEAENNSCQTSVPFILDFPGSGTRRNKFLCFINYLVYGILLQWK